MTVRSMLVLANLLRGMIGYWHDTVVCLSVSLSV